MCVRAVVRLFLAGGDASQLLVREADRGAAAQLARPNGPAAEAFLLETVRLQRCQLLRQEVITHTCTSSLGTVL